MKLLDTTPEISSEPLDRILKSCEVFHRLLTALDFDLFDRLEESKTVEQVSSEIGTDPFLTGKFLNALVALQFLSKKNDKYTNTKLASTYLVRDSPFYQGNLLRLSRKNADRRSDLGSVLKGEVPEAGERRFEDVFDSGFILAMAEGSMRGSLHRTMEAVSKRPEFRKAGKVLDLGGGHGLYAIAFAEMNPELEATVFDLPHVTEVTKKFIEKYGMGDRVRVIGGNFFEDRIGTGYDIIFASDVFYRKPDVLAGVLKKVYDALNNNGSVVFKHWIINDERTAPLTSVLFDLNLSRRGDSHIYTESECIGLLENARFSNVRVLDISSQTSPSVLIIGDKTCNK
jgi:predicted nicotinamide N-methyase